MESTNIIAEAKEEIKSKESEVRSKLIKLMDAAPQDCTNLVRKRPVTDLENNQNESKKLREA